MIVLLGDDGSRKSETLALLPPSEPCSLVAALAIAAAP